ncbi:poly(A) RNA polymerase gld-2 homolog A [Clonorchis sinensis]|uniref:Poly(A) RNA polymerase gld-2 homolog A n=1 Tax=Clonorchis sinensis TaxID=79923 RepID=G7YH63_CLOSI|nr:poly(A) RNA polymerase gld-2 homolog A [Clonorchis sinensis]
MIIGPNDDPCDANLRWGEHPQLNGFSTPHHTSVTLPVNRETRTSKASPKLLRAELSDLSSSISFNGQDHCSENSRSQCGVRSKESSVQSNRRLPKSIRRLLEGRPVFRFKDLIMSNLSEQQSATIIVFRKKKYLSTVGREKPLHLGPDGVHLRSLKESVLTVWKYFHLTYRQSLGKGNMPPAEKEVTVMSIHESVSSQHPNMTGVTAGENASAHANNHSTNGSCREVQQPSSPRPDHQRSRPSSTSSNQPTSSASSFNATGASDSPPWQHDAANVGSCTLPHTGVEIRHFDHCNPNTDIQKNTSEYTETDHSVSEITQKRVEPYATTRTSDTIQGPQQEPRKRTQSGLQHRYGSRAELDKTYVELPRYLTHCPGKLIGRPHSLIHLEVSRIGPNQSCSSALNFEGARSVSDDGLEKVCPKNRTLRSFDCYRRRVVQYVRKATKHYHEVGSKRICSARQLQKLATQTVGDEKRLKMEYPIDVDCPMGDHPPASSQAGVPAPMRNHVSPFFPNLAVPTNTGFSHSPVTAHAPGDGNEGPGFGVRSEATVNKTRQHQATAVQPMALGRASQSNGTNPTQLASPFVVSASRGLQMVASGPLIPPGAPLSFASAQPNATTLSAGSLLSPSPCLAPHPSVYMESLSLTIWHFFTSTRQTKTKYAKKVNLRNALHMVVSGVFENAGLFIVGSSMNGFGSDESDMDMCLTVTSRDLTQKKEAFAVLSQLLPPLRKCSFIRNLHLIRAKVPILKFRDTLAGVDCDLNVNNVVGIYNTHLLAMYTRIDWRVRPLGMFVKYWAQRMDIHDGSRGRLSTYPLLLMLIHYLQAGCTPPILPNLQAKYPKVFNYARPLCELDMRLELPWAELRSNNPASLAELFVGFIQYYTNEFDFTRWAVSVRHGAPLPIDVAIRRLPPHEQAHTARSFKVFVEEPFCQSNAARSLHGDDVLNRIRQAFIKTHQAVRSQRPLESIWVNPSNEGS